MNFHHPEGLSPDEEGFRNSKEAKVHGHPMHWDEVADNEELLNFANQVREAGGAGILDALIPSYPQESEACLIAKALNFDCSINDDLELWSKDEEYSVLFGTKHLTSSISEDLGYNFRESVWSMHITIPSGSEVRDKAHNIASKLNLPYSEEDYLVEILLPARIARAAVAFDTWGEYKGPDFDQYSDLVDRESSFFLE